MSFVEKVEQLNREIGATFDRALASLRRELQDRVRESHHDLDLRIEAFAPSVPPAFVAHEDLAPVAERLRVEARVAAFDELRDAFAALDRARTQAEVLAALIAGAGRFASRAALLLRRGDGLRGWGSQGFGDSEKALRDLVLSPADGGSWGRLAGAIAANGGGPQGTPVAAAANGAGATVQLSAADCAVLCGRIESPVPAFGVAVPLVLRDRAVALLYADQLAQPQPAPAADAAAGAQADTLSLPALQSLVYVAALAIESLPFRQRDATGTLAAPTAAAEPLPAGEAATAVAAAAPAPAPAETPAAAPPAEPAAAPAAEAPAAAPAAVPEAIAAAAGEGLKEALEPRAAEAAASAGAAPAAPAPPPGAEPGKEEDEADSTQPGLSYAGPRLAVTPADLYDVPRVPVVKETAEIPLPRPLRPVTQTSPLVPEPPRPADTVMLPRGESPYLEEAAAAAPPSAAETARIPAPEAPAEAAPAPAAASTLDVAAPSAGAAPPAGAAESAGAAAGGEHETVLLPHAARGPANLRAVPPVAPGPAGGARSSAGPPPVAAPPSPPAFEPLRTGPIGSGTPEVRPPSGVQGPGWAFSTTRVQATSSEEALHEEARRLARLLVSEIKLYNEEQVEAGRRNRDIYERLREDIDRSRQMYEERVEPRLVKSTDYFYQELVRILAAGDSKALGI